MRIAAVSDLHGHLPTIPACDAVLIAGDICPDFKGQYHVEQQADWFGNVFATWCAHLPTKIVYGTWGNHDWLGYHFTRSPVGRGFRSPLIKIDEEVRIGDLRVWFSPWMPIFGRWAWQRADDALEAINYAAIPDGIDVIVSHIPPHGYGDDVHEYLLMANETDTHQGSKALAHTCQRVKPRVVICGHVHCRAGYYCMAHMEGPNVVAATDVYNCSLVDDSYRPVNPVTIIEI